MVLSVAELPDDIDALKAMIQVMAREHAEIARGSAAQLDAAKAEIARLKAVEAAANERIANLTTIMNVLQRAQHGTRSERLRLAADDEQVAFAFEEVETGLAAIQSELDRAAGNLLAGLDWKKIRPARIKRPLLTG